MKIGALLAVLVALLAVGTVIAFKFVNLEQVKNMLTTQVKAATGRTLTIAGPLELQAGLVPVVIAKGVTLSNPTGSTRSEMAKIGQVEMEVALMPLLKREILVKRLIVSSPDILIETEAQGPGNLDFSNPTEKSEAKASEPAPSAPKEGGGYSFNLNELIITDGLVGWYDRASQKTEVVKIKELTLQPDSANVELLAVLLRTKVQEHNIELSGTIGRLATVLDGKPWPVNLKGTIAGITVSIDGSIAQLLDFRGLNLRLAAQGTELIDGVRLAGITEPGLPQSAGPFKVAAHLSDAGEQLHLTDVDLEAGKRDLLLLNAQGSVTDLTGAVAVDLGLKVESDSPAAVAQLTGNQWPIKGPVKGSGRLQGDSKHLHLTNVDLEAGKSDLLLLNAQGSVTDLTGAVAVDLGMKMESDSPATISQLTGNQWPIKGPIKGTGKLQGSSKQLHLTHVDFEAGKRELLLNAKGSVTDLTGAIGVDLALKMESDNLAAVALLTGREWPVKGPVKFSGRVRGNSKQLHLADMDLAAGDREFLLLNAKGSVTDLTGAVAVDLLIEVESDVPAAVAQMTGNELPIKGPVTLTGKVRGTKTTMKMTGFKATIGGSDLSGELAVMTVPRLQLSGKLASSLLNLADFAAPAAPAGPAPAGPEIPATQPAKAESDDGRVFPKTPLPVAALHKADADLVVQIGKLILNDKQLIDVVATVQLNAGRLVVKPFRFGLAGGVVEGEASLDAAGKTPVVALRLDGRQIELGKLDSKGPITGGKSDVKVDLKGSGESVRALMASASGETSISVGEGRLQNKAVDFAAGDLIFQVLGAINPFVKSEDTTQMTCAAVRLVLRDGVATADKGIAMRTSKVDVVGSGTIDLRSEGLDLFIKPRARGGVGLSLSSPLVGLVKVGGTLSKPSMGIDAAGTLRTAASVGAGVATGGLSVLGEMLLDKATTDEDPCRTALGQSQQDQSKQKAEPQRQSPGKLLQGLFGR
jgi:uncharacterized protein involved in outer membrane biogenesis